MLRNDVVEAIRDETFHIFPIKHVDEGIELLTGIPAGAPDADHLYPEDTINGKVQQKLTEMASNMSRFLQGGEQGGRGEAEE
jgi:hypothetical protein